MCLMATFHTQLYSHNSETPLRYLPTWGKSLWIKVSDKCINIKANIQYLNNQKKKSKNE